MVIWIVALSSCNDTPKKKTSEWTQAQMEKKRTLVKEVMEIHDEAMPWMETTHALRKEIKITLDSAKGDSLKTQLHLAKSFLDSADEAMMAWMRGYKEPEDTGSFDAAVQYLSSQKESALVMRNTMALSIKNARLFTTK